MSVALLSGIQTVAEVIHWFKEVGAFHRTKDAIYYQVLDGFKTTV